MSDTKPGKLYQSANRAGRTANLRAAEAASIYEASLKLRADVKTCACPCCVALNLQFIAKGI